MGGDENLFRSNSWEAINAKAERLSIKLALTDVCRAIDLLHVTIAVISRSGQFATSDEEQAKVAEKAGLELLRF